MEQTEKHSMEKNPIEYEKEYVQQFYDKIADQFNRSRYSVWPTVKEFLDQVKIGDAVLEVGCGNGKNLVYLKNRGFQPGELVIKGSDLCNQLCQITRDKLRDWEACEIKVADQLKLREHYVQNEFQFVLSIAVIHHLCTVERRIQAIEELIWVTAPGGRIMIQVWALEQPDDSRRRFEQGDNLVSWQLRDQKEVVDRYCHVFQKGELDQLIREQISQKERVIIRESYYSKGNWVLVLEKKK